MQVHTSVKGRADRCAHNAGDGCDDILHDASPQRSLDSPGGSSVADGSASRIDLWKPLMAPPRSDPVDRRRFVPKTISASTKNKIRTFESSMSISFAALMSLMVTLSPAPAHSHS